MKWLLKFIPFPLLINALCSLVKEKLTSKTETELDDKLVDKINIIAKEWVSYILNPTKDFLKICIRNTLNVLINFADEDALEELRKKINKK